MLTGARGAVLLYGVLAVAAWPQGDRADGPPAGWLPIAWAVLWVGSAVFQALPGQNTGSDIAGAIRDGADGAPQWLERLNTSVANWIGHHGPPSSSRS